MLGLDVNFQVFPGGEIPEHIQEMLARQIDQHQMAHTASYHSVFTLFDELNKEQTVTLGGIFRVMAAESPGLANFLEGIASTYMRLKHDTCMGCGTSHTPDFENKEDKADTPQPEPTVRPIPTEQITTDAEYAALLGQYRVESIYEDGIKFRCLGCGQLYPSLEDRMLRKPDDCGGCHQKAAWG